MNKYTYLRVAEPDSKLGAACKLCGNDFGWEYRKIGDGDHAICSSCELEKKLDGV